MDNIPGENSEAARTAVVLGWLGAGILAYGLVHAGMRVVTGGR